MGRSHLTGRRRKAREGISIDWGHLTQREYDRIVEALVTRLYSGPDVEITVYDGRGGDGGRDIVVRVGGRTLLHQLKYFPEGFSSQWGGRRRQITRSFDAAMQDHKPDVWYLVVPTNPTPGEEKFVQGLAAKVPGLKVKIRGRGFLDERLAGHQDLVDYFTRDQLREDARIFRQEQAMLLGGLPDLTDRVRGLARVADGLHPDWRIEWGMRAGVVEHRLIPKHPYAAARSPITLHISGAFGPQHALLRTAVERSLGFGTDEPVTLPPETVRSLTISAPAELALPNFEGPVELSWAAVTNPSATPTTARIDLLDAHGEALSSHEGPVQHTGSGSSGRSIRIDFEGLASLTLLIGADRHSRLDSHFTFTDAMPARVLQALSLFKDLHQSAAIELWINGTRDGMFSHNAPPRMDDQTANELTVRESLANDLAIVQRYCRSRFPVPADLSAQDRIMIRFMRLLADGHCVISPTIRSFTATLNGSHSEELDRVFSNPEPSAVSIESDLTVDLLGRQLRLGRVQMFHTQVEIADRAETLTALREGRAAGRTVTFAPVGGQYFRAFVPALWKGREEQPLHVTGWGLPGLDGPPVSASYDAIGGAGTVVTPEQRRALQAAYDYFGHRNTWPAFGLIDRKLRRAGPDPAGVFASIAPGLLVPFGAGRAAPLPEDLIQLTLTGMSLSEGSSDDIDRFLAMVRLAAVVEEEFDPGDDVHAVPRLTSDAVRQHLALPDGRGAIDRLFEMRLVQPWGFGSSGRDHAGTWWIGIERSIRHYAGVTTVKDYMTAREQDLSEARAVQTARLPSPRPTAHETPHLHPRKTPQGYAFISYVREDAMEIDRLQTRLEAAGVQVWRDKDRLWPGMDWRAEIRKAITSGSFAFLACFSGIGAAKLSSYQNEELLLAIDEMRRRPVGDQWLLPIRLSECDIPAYDLGAGRTLASIQWTDLFGEKREQNLQRLVTAVVHLPTVRA